MSTLKSDKFLQVKQRIETDEDGKVVKMNCYYINFKVFVNIVKYKLDLMRKKMETSERDATSRDEIQTNSCVIEDKLATFLMMTRLTWWISWRLLYTYCCFLNSAQEPF